MIVLFLLVKEPRDSPINFRLIYVCFSVCFLLSFVPWMIRNVIWTGYPLYPSILISFPVEWRVPRSSVITFTYWVRSWARMPRVYPAAVLNNWRWFDSWLDMQLQNSFWIAYPMFLGIGGLLFGFVFRRRIFPQGILREKKWLILFPSIGTLIYWFLTAPDLRFAGASFWTFGASVIVIVVHSVKDARVVFKKLSVILLSLSLIANFYFGTGKFFWEALQKEKSLIKAISILLSQNSLVARLGPEGGFHRTTTVRYKRFATDSGLIVYVPEEGDQCWDSPLPCTPYPNRNLRLRNKGNLRDGFIVVPRREFDTNVGHHP